MAHLKRVDNMGTVIVKSKDKQETVELSHLREYLDSNPEVNTVQNSERQCYVYLRIEGRGYLYVTVPEDECKQLDKMGARTNYNNTVEGSLAELQPFIYYRTTFEWKGPDKWQRYDSCEIGYPIPESFISNYERQFCVYSRDPIGDADPLVEDCKNQMEERIRRAPTIKDVYQALPPALANWLKEEVVAGTDFDEEDDEDEDDED